jgi:hypothetical protein
MENLRTHENPKREKIRIGRRTKSRGLLPKNITMLLNDITSDPKVLALIGITNLISKHARIETS